MLELSPQWECSSRDFSMLLFLYAYLLYSYCLALEIYSASLVRTLPFLHLMLTPPAPMFLVVYLLAVYPYKVCVLGEFPLYPISLKRVTVARFRLSIQARNKVLALNIIRAVVK